MSMWLCRGLVPRSLLCAAAWIWAAKLPWYSVHTRHYRRG